MRKDRTRFMIAVTELLLQCILFLSICHTVYLGVLDTGNAGIANGLWTVAAVVILYVARKLFRNFLLFYIANGLVLILSVLASTSGEMTVFNVFIAFIMCSYAIQLKNNEVRIYNDNGIPVREGQTAESVREAAIKSLVARENVHIYFVAVMVVGYVFGSSRSNYALVNLSCLYCVCFVLLQIIHNNLKGLNRVNDLNKGKLDYPHEQLTQVLSFVTIISVMIIGLISIMFYNGNYGNIFTIMGDGASLAGRLLGKAFLFLLGLSGAKSDNYMPPATDNTAERLEPVELIPQDNSIMELLAEIFGLLLIVGIVIGLFYILKTYIKNFNMTKKIGLDTVEYIRTGEKRTTVRSAKVSKNKPSREARNIRKMYKRLVIKGMGKSVIRPSMLPMALTKAGITEDERLSEDITRIYEKARYSEEPVSDEELVAFTKIYK